MELPNPNPRVAEPTFGSELLRTLPDELFECPVVHTQPEPWELVKGLFHARRASAGAEAHEGDEPGRVHVGRVPCAQPELASAVDWVHMVQTMEHARVREVSASFGPASAVFGIGGGSALDHAKYTAWTRKLPLILVPSLLSVDAAFTKAVGVREGSRVRYVGEVYPDHLLVDYPLIQAAPPLLNRAGAGDILSIFTALWDWKEAGARLGEAYFPDVAARSARLLERLLEKGEALRDVTPEGLRLLAELYVEEVRLCEMVGNSRPEEGSEHYLAYCIEAQTGGHYLHGQLVALCILVAGAAQGQDIGPVRGYLGRLGLDWRPEAVGVTRDQLVGALCAMPSYVREEKQLLPGVFHFMEALSAEDAEAILKRVL